MKKLHLSPEAEKALLTIADAAERYLSSRVFSPFWDTIVKAIVEEIDSAE